jgi:hypothetical protein
MSNGWAVKVTRMLPTGGGTQTEIWYAAIPGRTEAENAVREHVSAPSEASVVAEQPVEEAALRGLGLNEGQISQWS